MKTPYGKLAKFYTKYFGHMTKMAAMPIYGKNPLKNLLQNQKADDLGTWYVAFGMLGLTKYVQIMIVCWTLTYLIPSSEEVRSHKTILYLSVHVYQNHFV